MIYKNIVAFYASVLAIFSSGIAYADGSNEITFVNTTGRFVTVGYWGDSECINPPNIGSYPIGIDAFQKFKLDLKSDCGDSSITFTLSLFTRNSNQPIVGGKVTYRKYKGTNKQWLQKIEFVPERGVTFFNFMRATCGEDKKFCKGRGIPFTDAQAAVAILNPGIAADHMIIGYGKSR